MTSAALARYSGFIGAIYDCAVDPSRWEGVLASIAAQLNFYNATLGLNALPSGEPLLMVTTGTPPEWLARMPRYGSEAFELWGGVARIEQFPLDEPLVQSHQTPRESWEGNRFYAEWGRPQGLFDAVAIKLTSDPAMIGSITFGRAAAAGEVGESELEPLRLLAPHIRRAVAISKLLDLRSIEVATFASVIDGLAAGVVLVDRELRCVHINPAARSLACPGGPLTEANGRIGAADVPATAALASAVRLAADNESALAGKGIGVPVRDRAGNAFLIHVLPLGCGEIRAGLSRNAAAALFIAPAVVPRQDPADALALLYDLTPAETRVLMLVAGGRKQAEMARELGVLPSTVKTHLLRVFGKTGCGRQAELVRLVDSLKLPI